MGNPQSDGETKDARRGLQGPARDVAQLLYNFAKTARSFGFYARDNAAIASFIAELEEGFSAVLDEVGAIRLVVGADRFVWKGEDVYLNGDREKGLPFRLFRDGIRGLVFKPGLESKELLELLDVLSQRQSTGRSAEEDDVVTMLWKLSLNSVSYEAVEGFTHDLHGSGESADGGIEGGAEALPRMMERISGRRETLDRGQGARSFADDGSESLLADVVDGDEVGETGSQIYGGGPHYPIHTRKGQVELRYEAFTDEELSSLKSELDNEQVDGVPHLLDYCFELCQSEAGFFEPDDFAPMVGAMRRYLLRQRDVETYDRMLRYLRSVAEGGVYPTYLTRRAGEMLAECGGGDSVAALVASVVGSETNEELAWDALQVLLPDLDPVMVFDLLAHGMSESMAGILAATIIRRTGSDLTMFEEGLIVDEEPHVPRALASLRCLATLRTVAAVDVIARAVGWPDPLVRLAACRIMGRLPLSDEAAESLGSALLDTEEDVWREAMKSIHRQGDERLAPALLDWIGRHAFNKLDADGRVELVALAAELDPDIATAWFSDRIQMSLVAKMGGLVGTPEVIEWNYLSSIGLSHCATDDAILKLRDIRKKGDESFRQHVGRLVAQARRRKAERA
ncbi:MAG: HEAT repeat domain-containing protein [Deltaproteobacteria bacterium]|nr:HEAT repeat domain-containing protein [Deltaproteobacteria bacterium]